MLREVGAESEGLAADLADEALVRVEGLVVLLEHLRGGEGFRARRTIVALDRTVYGPGGDRRDRRNHSRDRCGRG